MGTTAGPSLPRCPGSFGPLTCSSCRAAGRLYCDVSAAEAVPQVSHVPNTVADAFTCTRALDLVAIGFAKPEQFYGNTISTREELLSASAAFKVRGPARVRMSLGAGTAAGLMPASAIVPFHL